MRGAWLPLGLCLLAASALAQPLEPAWTETPAGAAAFLDGAPPDQGDGGLWIRTANGALWGVASLPRVLLAVGRGRSGVSWRRTGRAGGVWREDRVRITVPAPGLGGVMELHGAVAGPRGAAWPPGGWLAWRPALVLPGGWDLEGRWDLVAAPQPWLERPRPRVRIRRHAGSWLAWGAWSRDRDGRAGLDLGAVRRFGAVAALEAGRLADGSPHWALLARRGPLLVRAAQGWQPLLGVWRTWEVSLCGPGR